MVGIGITGLTALGAYLQKGNPAIQAGWQNLANTAKDAGKRASAGLVDPLTAGMDNITALINKDRPLFTAMFNDAGKDLPSLISGIDQLAGNALPDLVGMMNNSQPIARGLGGVIGSVGTITGQVAGSVASNSQAIGTGLNSLSGLVTTLGHGVSGLVGAASQLSGGAITALTGGVGGAVQVLTGLENVIRPIAPELGAVAGSGLSAYTSYTLLSKVSSPLADGLDKVNAKLDSSNPKFTGIANVAQNVVGGLKGIVNAVPIVGAVISGLQGIMAQSTGTAGGLASSLLQGGSAAQLASQQIANNTAAIQREHDALGPVGDLLSGIFIPSQQDVLNQLTPLQQKQALYNQAIAQYGTNSKQAASALSDLGIAQTAQTASANAMTGALNRQTLGATAASSNTATLAQDVQILGDNSASAQTKVSALQSAVHILGENGQETQNDAISALYQGINQLSTQMPSLAGGMLTAAGTFDLTTTKGETVRATLEQMGGQIAAYNQGLVQMGDSQQQADLMTQALVDQIAGPLANTLHISKQQAIDMINTYAKFPSSITTDINADPSSAMNTLAQLQLAAEHMTIFVPIKGVPDPTTGRLIYGPYSPSGHATGGIVAPTKHASGGVTSPTPIPAMAAIGGPNSYLTPDGGQNIFGDLPRLSEAYIPIDSSSPRSNAVLDQVNAAMGRRSGGQGGGTVVNHNYSPTINATATNAVALAQEVQREYTWYETVARR